MNLDDIREEPHFYWGWGFGLSIAGLLFNWWLMMLIGALMLTAVIFAEAGWPNHNLSLEADDGRESAGRT